MAERKKFLLRMSPPLWDALNRWAAQEFRSVNGQIEFILQRAVQEKYGKKSLEEESEGDPTADPAAGGPPPSER